MGKHQHRLANQCSPCEKIVDMKCGDMGMGHLSLRMSGHLWLIMGGALGCSYGLNGWSSYDKVGVSFGKMLVLR